MVIPKIKSDSSQKLAWLCANDLHISSSQWQWDNVPCTLLRTIVSISFQFSGPGMNRWLLPEQPLGCCLAWQHIQCFPRAPLGFDTFFWSILSCHTILGLSGHCGGAEQWQAEVLYRAVCWGGGLNTVQKIWLLKRNKEHVRAAA